MTTDDLADFIRRSVPGFSDLRIEQEGCGYHYTSHGPSILRSGGFLGVPPSKTLIATQRTAVSIPGTDPDGVVFAYPAVEKAAQMGRGQDIFRIFFRSAVSAFHLTEREIERRHGLIDSRTLLIVATEILRFECLGSAENYLRATSGEEL